MAERSPSQSSSAPSSSGNLMQDAADAFAIGRSMLAAGRHNDARALLRALTIKAPAFEAAWLQLLAMEPPLAEEIELLEGFLQHHPEHHFAEAFRARLHDRQIVLMINQTEPVLARRAEEDAPAPVRLGDYLIKQHWVTPEQVEHALKEQQRLRAAGFEQRLGTILLMQGHLSIEQLAEALGSSLAAGFGEFGDYLVRTHVLTRNQVALALARQSALRAEYDQEYLEELTSYHHKLRAKLLNSGPPVRKSVPRLGEVMVEMGLLTEEQVDATLEERRRAFNALFE